MDTFWQIPGEEIEFRNDRWWLLGELGLDRAEKNRCLPVKVRVCRDKRYPMEEKVGEHVGRR